MKTYAVYLASRIKPYIAHGKSPEEISRKWKRQYNGQIPMKVVEVVFDEKSGEYIQANQE